MTDTTVRDIREPQPIDDLSVADQGSWYTIFGVGGQLAEWVEGYEDILERNGISAPTAWHRTTSDAINAYAERKAKAPIRASDRLPSGIVVLLFPLEGLTGNLAVLPILKVQNQDRWFDDVVSSVNMRAER